MIQKWSLKIIDLCFEKYGPLILAIIISLVFGYWQREEKLENRDFYREQQVKWYNISTEQTDEMKKVVEKNTETMTGEMKVLNELILTVKLLAARN